MDTPTANRKRGGCLTLYLIVMLFANALTGLIYLFAGLTIAEMLRNVPQWAILLFTFFAFANCVFGLAIWNWKKWGVYGFVGSTIVVLVFNVVILGIAAGIFSLVSLAVTALLLFVLLRPVWNTMESSWLDRRVFSSRERAAFVILVFLGSLAIVGIGVDSVRSMTSKPVAASSAPSLPSHPPAVAASDINRYFEVSGGYSYVPPKGWQLRDSPDPRIKYKIAVGPQIGGRTPSINILDQDFGGSLDDYVNVNLLSLRFSPGFQLLTQGDFQPNEGDRAIKLVTRSGSYDGQFTQYFFNGPHTKFVITCTQPSTMIETIAEACDQSIMTFRFEAPGASLPTPAAFQPTVPPLPTSRPRPTATLASALPSDLGAPYAHVAMSVPLNLTGVLSHLTVDDGGNIYIAEDNSKHIQILDSTGKYTRSWDIGNEAMPNYNPYEIAADHAGNLYIRRLGGILKYDAQSGQFLAKLDSPTDVTYISIDVLPDNTLYITDNSSDHNDIVHLDSELKEIGRIKNIIANVPGQTITNPLATSLTLGADQQGNLYLNLRQANFALDNVPLIFKFDRNGKYVTGFGSVGNSPSQLTQRVYAVALDNASRVFVAGTSNRIIVFDASGQFLGEIGGAYSIDDMTINARNEIYAIIQPDGALQRYLVKFVPNNP